jgi:hypothetical protein
MMRESTGPQDVATATYDPLDLHMQRLGVSRRSTWSKVSSQATLLLLTGIALGPQGLSVLTPEILEVLQPGVPVALAVLGVTVAFGRLEEGAFPRRAARLFSVVILLAGLAMALRQRAPAEALATVSQAACIAILIAGAGWMLSSRGANAEERRVFSMATFLLLGGAADYLSVSGLLLGWVAATAWRLVRTPALADARLDAAYVQHPVTALLLVTAGARVQFSWEIALLALATVGAAIVTALVLRRWWAGRATFGASLTPAAFVVALAMDAARNDTALVSLLSVVVLAASTLDVFSGQVKDGAA